VYKDYKKQFPNYEFQFESLKDRLRKCLKELKIGTSNEQGKERVALQFDHVTPRLSLRPATPPPVLTFESSMTKFETLQSQ
jgi:hypothetical protein